MILLSPTDLRPGRSSVDRKVQRRQNRSRPPIFRTRPAILANHLPPGRLEPSRQKAPASSLTAAPFNIQVRDVAGNQQVSVASSLVTRAEDSAYLYTWGNAALVIMLLMVFAR